MSTGPGVDPRGPRFAAVVTSVVLAVALVGTIGYAAGLPALGIVATAFALFAAFGNAAFGFCLGCEMYLLAKRSAPRMGRA